MVKRRSFTLSFKLRVLRYAQDSSISTAAKHYKVSRRCIQKWRLQLEQIQEAKMLHQGDVVNHSARPKIQNFEI